MAEQRLGRQSNLWTGHPVTFTLYHRAQPHSVSDFALSPLHHHRQSHHQKNHLVGRSSQTLTGASQRIPIDATWPMGRYDAQSEFVGYDEKGTTAGDGHCQSRSRYRSSTVPEGSSLSFNAGCGLRRGVLSPTWLPQGLSHALQMILVARHDEECVGESIQIR